MDEVKNDPKQIWLGIWLQVFKIQIAYNVRYIQECSRIMDISEQVLVHSAQLSQRCCWDWKKHKQDREKKSFDVVKMTSKLAQKVDILYRLERKIIEILLLYELKSLKILLWGPMKMVKS
jgi:DNA primase